MIFNKHSALEGQHAFLGASKYHWINYDESKVAESYSKFLATQKGTELHDFAARCITLGQKLPKSQKAVNELQRDVVIADNEVTGTLKYIDGYVGFSSNVSEQSGNYLAIKIDTEPVEAKTVVELVGGTKGPVTLDEDRNIVLLIKNKDTQSIKVTITHDKESIEKTYGLSGLTLERE